MQTLNFILSMVIWSSLAIASSDTSKKSDGAGNAHGASDQSQPPPEAPKGPSRNYNPGKITKFPSFQAISLATGGEIKYEPQKGRATLVIFIASWCDPCQILMGEFNQIARKYSSQSTDVFFVFAHDTKDDATGFMKEHQISSPVLMANQDLLKAFKNPELPSIYIADRWGYLADRFIKVKKDDIQNADLTLAKITAL
jgi:thiol-disulfide isomerase/thioredoxin